MDVSVEEIDESTLSRKKTLFYRKRAQHFRKAALYFSRGNAQIDLQPQKRTNFPLKRLAFMLQSPTFPPKSFQKFQIQKFQYKDPCISTKEPYISVVEMQESNLSHKRASHFRHKMPIFLQRKHVFLQESPTFRGNTWIESLLQKSPMFPLKSPAIAAKEPYVSYRSPFTFLQ